jgi:hypothetical protein
MKTCRLYLSNYNGYPEKEQAELSEAELDSLADQHFRNVRLSEADVLIIFTIPDHDHFLLRLAGKIQAIWLRSKGDYQIL